MFVEKIILLKRHSFLVGRIQLSNCDVLCQLINN